MPEIYLKVDSAYPEDQGGGKARLDPETMLQLRVSPGDIVLIEGRRRTVAKVWRALVTDWNQGKIRIDNITRANAGVSIGDRIRVAKLTEEIEARRVVLAPPVDLPSNMPINLEHAMNSLIDFPVVEGDSVPIRQGFPFMQPQIVAFKAVSVEPGRGRDHLQEHRDRVLRQAGGRVRGRPADLVRGHRRAQLRAPAGPRDDRAPDPAPRALPPPRDRAAEGRAPVRPARDGQDAHRQGRRERVGGALHRDRRAGGDLEVLRRVRAASPRGLRGGPRERTCDHLHRRARLDRAQTRGRDGRGRAARGRASS